MEKLLLLLDLAVSSFGGIALYSNLTYTNVAPNSSWVQLGGNYYYISNYSTYQYYEASAICRSMGTELASITSEYEKNLILNYYNSKSFLSGFDLWFGAHKKQRTVNGEVYFTDGSQSTYTNWEVSQPDEKTCCVRLRYQLQWADPPCTYLNSLICKLHLIEKVKTAQHFVKRLQGQYINNFPLQVVPNKRCLRQECALSCLKNKVCYGFNFHQEKIGVCSCELTGNQPYATLPHNVKSGSSYWD